MSAAAPFPTARLVGTPAPPAPAAAAAPAAAPAPAVQAPSPAPEPTLPAPAPAAASTAPATGLGAYPGPSSGGGLSAGTVAAGVLLLGLAVAALLLGRKRRRAARLVEIVESASLGPRRQLVVARLGDELLVLGSSEGGVSLLATRPASALRATHAPAAAGRPAAREEPPAPRAPATDLLGRLRDRLAPRRADRFSAALAESVEDAELRRKLAAGQGGRVP